jgi:predicted RNA-binding Zn-ribbon protein involved in translation (DUF1610 family)
MAQRAWVQMYCGQDRRARVATFQLFAEEWQIFSVGGPEPSAEGAAGGLPVSGAFGISTGYEGCPGCGADSYARCGACRQLGCWRSSEPVFTCGNCGHGGPVSGRIESLGALDVG